jgi:hypothetical protein
MDNRSPSKLKRISDSKVFLPKTYAFSPLFYNDAWTVLLRKLGRLLCVAILVILEVVSALESLINMNF